MWQFCLLQRLMDWRLIICPLKMSEFPLWHGSHKLILITVFVHCIASVFVISRIFRLYNYVTAFLAMKCFFNFAQVISVNLLNSPLHMKMISNWEKTSINVLVWWNCLYAWNALINSWLNSLSFVTWVLGIRLPCLTFQTECFVSLLLHCINRLLLCIEKNEIEKDRYISITIHWHNENILFAYFCGFIIVKPFAYFCCLNALFI